VKGRKRHIVVDVLGLVKSCFVSAANVADIKAAAVVLVPALEANSAIEKFWLTAAMKATWGVVYRPSTSVCWKLGNAWARISWSSRGVGWWNGQFAWLENARRLCRDYEQLPEHHESFVYLTMMRLMLPRLTHNQRTRAPVTSV
jgi:putative transposase